MKVGLPISLALHVGVFGGFTLFAAEARPFSDAVIIPVEILTIAPETNVSAAIKTPKPQPIVQQPEIMTSPTPMENADEEAPEVKITTQKKSVEKVAEVVPEIADTDDVIPVPKPDPKPPEPTFDLDALAGLVDKTRETAPETNQQVALESETAQARYEEVARRAEGEGSGLSATEADLVANAMYKCWRMPAAAKDAENLRVRLNVKFVIGGHVEKVELIDQAASRRLSPGNEYWDIAERSAVAAVNKCSPYDFLSDERYGVWRELILNLRPQL
jgi:hypothetical protein